MRSLEGQVAVVTGGSAGVGRATVRALADAGADVAILARGQAGRAAARREVEEAGRRALDISVDVADAEQVEAAAEKVERELGPIDLWINNAMVSVFAPFKEISARDFARVTDVVYHGYVHGTMSALRRMLPRDRGCIVQVGSALAYRGIPLQSAYCGAKHAIQGFTESVRCELLHDNSAVRITSVHMPALNTPQFHWVKTDLKQHPQPVPPIFQPELAAQAILWAATHDRREVLLGAPTSLGIAANKLMPGLIDHHLARTGYESQQADMPIEPGRPDNLWEPVDKDHGAHGEFDERSRRHSLQWWLTTRRKWLVPLGALAGVAAWAGASRRD